MPSLTPKPQMVIPPLDLRAVFASERTKPTVERVVKYIGFYYDRFTVVDEAAIDTFAEEFFLQMPTVRAFAAEIELCQAILAHSEGRMSDLEIKAVLDAFIAAHSFYWLNGKRDVKDGDFDQWADCDLVHVYQPGNERVAFTCNPIQSWLIYFLHAGENLRVLRLND